MGDRSNCVVRFAPPWSPDAKEPRYVYLYGHNAGVGIADDVAAALRRRVRWDDPQYLCRIIYDVIADGRFGTEHGFGISPGRGDSDHALLVVDGPSATLWLAPEDSPETRLISWSFEDFLRLESPSERMREFERGNETWRSPT